MFINIADLSLSKKQNTQQTSGKMRKNMKPKKKWFDNECKTFKAKTKKLAILQHKNPWNNSLRDTHRNITKEYKKACDNKK